MDVEKMKKWLELTDQYQKSDFWRKIFDHHSPEQFFDTNEATTPAYDVYQNESHNCVIIEVPGIAKKDIQLSLQSKTHLLVKGNFRPLFPTEMEIKKERYYGEFERLIPLPEPTEAGLIQIHFYQGLIQVLYPRQIEPLLVNELL